jgi:predicted Zn-dependent protease with MMP-like domain
MDEHRFSQLVADAVDALPEEFKELLSNVDVVVADEPNARQKQRLSKGSVLLGLYEGIPQTKRGSHYNLALPDKITIFQKSIESICRTDDGIVDQIGKTVRHEIAHHFGISDERLKQLEEARRRPRTSSDTGGFVQ